MTMTMTTTISPSISLHGRVPCPLRRLAGIQEVKARLVTAPPKYIIKVIDKDGTRVVAEV